MENEFESTQPEFEDIVIEGDTLTRDVLFGVMRTYIATHMSRATLSKFDDCLDSGEYSMEEAAAAAMLNEALLKLWEELLSRERHPIQPFNV